MSSHHEVVVVVGGQAGLAIGHHLARQVAGSPSSRPPRRPPRRGGRRWDSLKLFTPVRHDSLPGLPFPGDPGRDEVVAYLTDYARHFGLPVELDSPVRSLRRGDTGYVLGFDDRTCTADQVVVATGPFQIPGCPPSPNAPGLGHGRRPRGAAGVLPRRFLADRIAADRRVPRAVGPRADGTPCDGLAAVRGS